MYIKYAHLRYRTFSNTNVDHYDIYYCGRFGRSSLYSNDLNAAISFHAGNSCAVSSGLLCDKDRKIAEQDRKIKQLSADLAALQHKNKVARTVAVGRVFGTVFFATLSVYLYRKK